MTAPRLGVIGLGLVAQAIHLPLLAKRRDLFEVVALCDRAPGLVEPVRARFGLAAATGCASAGELLDRDDLDAVMVLTSGSHGALAAAVLRRGLPLLVEKPLAYTLAEADELATIGGRLMVGYMKLHDPAVERAAELVQPERLRAVDVTVLHPPAATQLGHTPLLPPAEVPLATLDADRERDDALREWAIGPDVPDDLWSVYVDALLGSVIHDLAVVRALTGTDPERIVHADAWPPPFGDRDQRSLAVDAILPGGPRLTIRWHYLDHYPTYREEVRLHHDTHTVALTFPSPYLLHAPTMLTVTDRHDGTTRTTTHTSTEEAFERQLAAFHRLVTAGAPPAPGIPEGRADILTCQRATHHLAHLHDIPLGGEIAGASP